MSSTNDGVAAANEAIHKQLVVHGSLAGGAGTRPSTPSGGQRSTPRYQLSLYERTNEFFINEGKGISTILFFIQPSGKTKSTKTIENKIIINSKTHLNY